MGKFNVKRICIDGMLAAIYIVLSVASFSIAPNVQITFAGLAIVVAAMAYGTADAVIIATIGAFLSQLRSSYGLTITTPLWMIPPILRAVVVGVVAFIFRKRGTFLENHPIATVITVVMAAIVVTAANTLVMWLDAVIIGYSMTWVVATTLIRFGVGAGEAALIAIVVIPLMRALRSAGLLDKLKKKEAAKEGDEEKNEEEIKEIKQDLQ